MVSQKFSAGMLMVVLALLNAGAPLATVRADEAPTWVFHTGAAGDPTWTILKLHVTQEDVIPRLYYETPALRCPMTWGTELLAGPPGHITMYEGLAFTYHAGRTGYDTQAGAVIYADHRGSVQNDGADHCLFQNATVEFANGLPLGTVYLFQFTTGVPFEGTVTLRMSGPGVTIDATSTGASSFYVNETRFYPEGAADAGTVVMGPPWCGNPQESLNCPQDHMNEGGGLGASETINKFWIQKFKHHPFYMFHHDAFVSASNSSVVGPDGATTYEQSTFAQAGGMNVRSGGMTLLNDMAPSGQYEFHVAESVDAVTSPGWYVTGADLVFPGET